jgi:hypothetical protein
MNNIILHRKAYFKIAKQLGVMKLRFYLHDLDKLILSTFMGDKLATKLTKDEKGAKLIMSIVTIICFLLAIFFAIK